MSRYLIPLAVAMTLGCGETADWLLYEGPLQLFAIRADGSGQPVQLTTGADFWSPSWSPDGRMIAAGRWDFGLGLTLVVMNADGSGQRALSAGSAPTWSTDRSTIIYTVVDGQTRQSALRAIRLDGTGDASLLSDASEPAWWPGGAAAFRAGRPEVARPLVRSPTEEK